MHMHVVLFILPFVPLLCPLLLPLLHVRLLHIFSVNTQYAVTDVCAVLSGSVFSRRQSKAAGTTVTQSAYSKAEYQPLIGASSMSSMPLVTVNKLQISGSVCVTLVKGSLVQQQVNVLHMLQLFWL